MTSHEGLPVDTDVSPVASFVLREKDLLQISATVSICLFLQAPVGRLVAHVLSRYGGRKFKTLSAMLQPCIWGRLVMEIGGLLAIVILTIEEAFHLNIRPFTRDPLLPASTCLRLIYNIAIGRFLVVVGNILSAYDFKSKIGHRIKELRSLTGHTGKPSFDLVYFVTCIVSNVITLGFGENHLLVLTSSVMELNCMHLAFMRLSQLVTHCNRSRGSLKSAFFCSAIFFITRIILPIIFLGLAIRKESPFLMTRIPLIWFAFCCFFYGIFHIYLIHHSARQLIQALSHTSALPPPPSIQQWRNDFAHRSFNNTSSFAIPYSSDIFTNDLRSSLDSVKSPVTGKSPQTRDWHEKAFIESKIGLDYGFLHCYDNRNLCSSRISGVSEKVNIGLKKSTEKEKMFCWSDHAVDVTDKGHCQMMMLQKDDKSKGETGSLLSFAGAEKAEESSENYMADDELNQQWTIGLEKAMSEKVDDSSDWDKDDHQMSSSVEKLFGSISLTKL